MAGIGPATSPLPRECSTTEPKGQSLHLTYGQLERETGIEPVSLAWKAKVLPLNYSRIDRHCPRGMAFYTVAVHQSSVVEEAGFEPA